MEKAVLLVVDVQNGLVENNPYNRNAFLSNVRNLIAAGRRRGIEVVYVRHDGSGRGMLCRGSREWEIVPEVAPLAGEKIFDKCFCSAFGGTGLKEYLDGKGIGTIILVGMQTEYCIDTTCKVAFEYGYKVIIPQGATTTFDNPPIAAAALCEFYENKVWGGGFAEVLPAERVLNRHDFPDAR